ncbi:MAG: hypothetical protein JNK68_06625 [Betaproteobacteria bacterium]|nr:hypothetical protein [Betaproteobacteria bacterium]
MADILDLVYLFGQTLSVLALAAGMVMSLSASDTFGGFFAAARPKLGRWCALPHHHRLNPMDHSGYEW